MNLTTRVTKDDLAIEWTLRSYFNRFVTVLVSKARSLQAELGFLLHLIWVPTGWHHSLWNWQQKRQISVINKHLCAELKRAFAAIHTPAEIWGVEKCTIATNISSFAWVQPFSLTKMWALKQTCSDKPRSSESKQFGFMEVKHGRKPRSMGYFGPFGELGNCNSSPLPPPT